MRLILLLTLAIVVASCGPKDSSDTLFQDLVDKEEVTLVLSNYGLKSIPAEIGRLKNVQTLTVSLDTLNGWTIYPPLSALDHIIDRPPFQSLPDEITELKSLRKLTIHGLSISKLPDNFDNLENLEYLDLSMNKLIVSDELNKLKGLKNLKHLVLLGNRIDTLVVQNWSHERPDLQIQIGKKFSR